MVRAVPVGAWEGTPGEGGDMKGFSEVIHGRLVLGSPVLKSS